MRRSELRPSAAILAGIALMALAMAPGSVGALEVGHEVRILVKVGQLAPQGPR